MAACVGERGRGIVMADCGLAFSLSPSLPVAVYGDFVKPSNMPPRSETCREGQLLSFSFLDQPLLGDLIV